MLKINNYELESNNDLVIAHFSDIHFSNHFNTSRLQLLISELKKTKPDYICITGDLIDNLGVTNKKGMNKLLKFLDDLSNISKVIIGLGNHDTGKYRRLKDNGWYNNLNKNLVIVDDSYYEDNQICFYGITMRDNYYRNERKNIDDLSKKISKIELSNDKYNILLIHSPLNFDREEISKINQFDLVLAGHTHNGLTPHIFPGNFGLIGPHHGLCVKNARNSFKSGKSEVIISGGITKIAVGAGILHIFNSLYASDLNYIHLKRAKKL